jgi:hypothetical protein
MGAGRRRPLVEPQFAVVDEQVEDAGVGADQVEAELDLAGIGRDRAGTWRPPITARIPLRERRIGIDG